MRRHLSFANVTAVLALFIALGGGAYAITKAPKNSVTSKSIENGAVSSKDVRNDGLTGKDIDEDTLDGAGGPAASFVELDGQQPLTGTSQTVLEDSVSTGSETMLFIQASVSLTGNGGNNDVASCTISIDQFGNSDTYEGATSGGGDGAGSLSAIFAVPVNAGSHQMALNCQSVGGNPTISAAGMATWSVG